MIDLRRASWAIVLLAAACPARAERSPGPLSTAHQGLDDPNQCQSCHNGGHALSNDKCLGCHDHEGLRQRISDGKGFHASAKANGRPCYLCHTEHKGRGRDILGFSSIGGIEKFDHQLTGWPLGGAHAKTGCNDCHTKKGKFSGAPTTCDGCHKTHPHGDLRAPVRRCDRCHTVRNWNAIADLQFDHNNPGDARYPLEGKHAPVDCARCHQNNLFRLGSGGPPDCGSCHKNPHPEGGLFAKNRCGSCHSARSEWKVTTFDHAKGARFPLDGAHAKVACATCHLPNRARTPRACEGCHNDPHASRFNGLKNVRDCNSCHTAKLWADTHRFDHLRATGYALTGKHAEAACHQCHRGKSAAEFEKLDGIVTPEGVRCMSCHQHENAHKKQFKDAECLRCHLAAGKNQFKPEAIDRFHGAGARFPLLEGHEGVACDKCHKNDVYQGTTMECGPSCHEDKLHQGSLGKTCTRCHGGGHWAADRFDHDDSAYPLVGHHADVACELCHPAKRYKPTPTKCGEGPCHGNDDAHQGTLGKECERCHTPSGRSVFDHNDKNAPKRFKLVGKHARVPCAKCHPSTVFPTRPTACEGCHALPARHLGVITPPAPKTPATATSATGAPPAPGIAPATGTAPAIGTASATGPGSASGPGTPAGAPTATSPATGAAKALTTGTSTTPLARALAIPCADCHDATSWTSFHKQHETGVFKFAGAHDRQPCGACHEGGRSLRGTADLCVSCHRRDDIHHNSLGPRCGECHRQEAWSGPQVRFFHERVGCDLRGIHRVLPCLDCHVGGNFVALSPACVACHRGDAMQVRSPVDHRGLLSTPCTQCHNVNSFAGMPRPGGRESVCQ